MTPKEKASELVKKFSAVGLQRRAEGIVCALIAVDEIINSEPRYPSLFALHNSIDVLLHNHPNQHQEAFNYWQQVKQEIQKL